MKRKDRIKSSWERGFYGENQPFREDIFRIPHKDLSKFFKWLEKIKAKNILDLGCGTGRHTIPLAKKGFQVYGIDIAEPALRIAGERLKEENLKANLKIGDIYKKLPYQDNFFDGVISTNVLHHAKTSPIKGLIKELERVIRPGGILILEVPKMSKKRVSKNHKEIELGTYIRLTGPEKGILHHFFSSKKELKNFFSNFEPIDIYQSKREKQSSPHYTMLSAKLKKTL